MKTMALMFLAEYFSHDDMVYNDLSYNYLDNCYMVIRYHIGNAGVIFEQAEYVLDIDPSDFEDDNTQIFLVDEVYENFDEIEECIKELF